MMIIIIIIIITISKSFRKYVSDIPGNHDVKELQKTVILGHCTHTQKIANLKEQQNQRRNQTQRDHKQQRQNSCNNVSPRDMVCLGNMCVATLHKADNNAIIIIYKFINLSFPEISKRQSARNSCPIAGSVGVFIPLTQ